LPHKLHWAITGKTAAEIIYTSADAGKIHMGLTHWKQSPDGKIVKSDVSVLKAEQEFKSYRKRQDREFISDFDREIKRIQGRQEGSDEQNL
jgi:hypothetical protein